MDLAIEWSFVREPGWVLMGKQFDSKKPHEKRHKVAMFDLNMTILVSKSGTLHGLDENDWTWWRENVPVKLEALYQQGYIIVIASNQGRLTTLEGGEAPEAPAFKSKMESVMRELAIPVTTMVACANDICRKPRIGMWSVLESDGPLNAAESFVVGDAAGRPKDFSDSDLHLAENLGVGFFTPEVFFEGAPAEELGHKFNPSLYLPASSERKGVDSDSCTSFGGLGNKLVVLVGLPGAGKTTHYHSYFACRGYKRINMRSESDKDRCRERVGELLAQGETVVIDDESLYLEARRAWLSLAKENCRQAMALNFVAPADLCLHNDSFRALAGHKYNPEQRPIYPKLLLLDLANTCERPTVEEGFESIVDVEFEWRGTDEDAAIWKRYWT